MTNFAPTRVPMKGDCDLGGTNRPEVDLGWGGFVSGESMGIGSRKSLFTKLVPQGSDSESNAVTNEKSGDFDHVIELASHVQASGVEGSAMGIRGNIHGAVPTFFTEKPVPMCSCVTWLGGRAAEWAA